jgi:putative type I site-specific restriction-modification system, S subunit
MREWKATDNEWFPQIPADWRLEPLKKFTTTSTGITFTKADLVEEGNCVLSYGQVHAKNNPQTYVNPELVKYIPDSLIESKESAKVKQHDFIFADTSEDLAGCGNCIYIAEPIVLYAGYHTILLRNVGLECGRYFAYQFMSDEWRSQIRKRVKSVKLFSVTQGILNQTFVFIPPVAEQEAIAEYLDKECEKIGRNIELLERKADAYKRLRRSIINHAVTRGLNPNAPLKPSGIPWIVSIPEHWDIKRGKSLFQEVYRDVRPEDGTVTCFRDGEVTLRTNRRTTGFTESEKEIGYHGVRVGDLVIHQMDAFAGSIGISDSDGKCSPICIVCRPLHENEVDLGYYCQLLRVMAHSGFIQSLAKGIRERTTDFRYKTLVTLNLPVPPYIEQQQIAAYLNEKCGKIDAIIEKIGNQIERLKELKRSLINEVVTGKRAIINV